MTVLTLTDPVSIIGTVSNLRPGERVVVWPAPSVAYVIHGPDPPETVAACMDTWPVDFYDVDDPPIDYNMLRAYTVYVWEHGRWRCVKGGAL